MSARPAPGASGQPVDLEAIQQRWEIVQNCRASHGRLSLVLAVYASQADVLSLMDEVRRLREAVSVLQGQLARSGYCWCDPEGTGRPGEHQMYDRDDMCRRCLGDRPPARASRREAE